MDGFKWNADEVLKLLDRGYRVVLFKDGLGDVTAIAVPPGDGLTSSVREWREFDPPTETIEDMQRAVFDGPNRRSGGGRTVSQALHSLTEKVVFGRLPNGSGGYFEPPAKPEGE